MRICLVYDCLFPHTVGGAERWYRRLAERLAADGHSVTYLTLRQWERGNAPEIHGVDVRAVGPQMHLYSSAGQRRILPPVVFGTGVLWHLLRRGRQYDVVHTASFPYFSLLGAATARRVRGFRLVVDWHEVWSRSYWRDYLGRLGSVGWLVQHACIRCRQSAFCFSRLHAARLRENGIRGPVTILEGEYDGPVGSPIVQASPLVVFAGRHIPEKRAPAVVPAVVCAAARIPDLQAVIFGDGPERHRVIAAIRDHEAELYVTAPGFVSSDELLQTLAKAMCMLLPSSREGYGMIVVEAAALGVPSIVVRGPDNASTELVEDGVNGFIASTADPCELADAIVAVRKAGADLRESTAAWYRENAVRLSLANSLERVVVSYAAARREPA